MQGNLIFSKNICKKELKNTKKHEKKKKQKRFSLLIGFHMKIKKNCGENLRKSFEEMIIKEKS